MFIVITNKVKNFFSKLYILLKSKNSIKKSDFEKLSDLILPCYYKTSLSHIYWKMLCLIYLQRGKIWWLVVLRLCSLFINGLIKHALKSMLKSFALLAQMHSFHFRNHFAKTGCLGKVLFFMGGLGLSAGWICDPVLEWLFFVWS